MPLKIDLGLVVQGAMLMALGVVLLVVWLLASALSLILPFGSPQSLLSIGVILLLGGIGFALLAPRFHGQDRVPVRSEVEGDQGVRDQLPPEFGEDQIKRPQVVQAERARFPALGDRAVRSVVEIAEIMDCPIPTAQSRVRLAYDKLRESLETTHTETYIEKWKTSQ